MLKCNGKRTDKCTWCSHASYHTKKKHKWRDDYKNFDGTPMKQVKHCDRKTVTCTERQKNCEGCEFLERGFVCALSTEPSDLNPCLKGKVTIEDLVLLFNRILPIVFAEGSRDHTNVASALMKYPRYDLSTKSFTRIKKEKR